MIATSNIKWALGAASLLSTLALLSAYGGREQLAIASGPGEALAGTQHWVDPSVASSPTGGARRLEQITGPRRAREVDRYRRLALSSPDALVVSHGIRNLSRLHAFAWEPEFLRFLVDYRVRVRQEAVLALGRCGDVDVVPYLLPSLRDPAPVVRVLVIKVLGELGGDEARDALLELFESPSETEMDRALARAALGDQ